MRDAETQQNVFHSCGTLTVDVKSNAGASLHPSKCILLHAPGCLVTVSCCVKLSPKSVRKISWVCDITLAYASCLLKASNQVLPYLSYLAHKNFHWSSTFIIAFVQYTQHSVLEHSPNFVNFIARRDHHKHAMCASCERCSAYSKLTRAKLATLACMMTHV